jgi:hypothetical protein
MSSDPQAADPEFAAIVATVSALTPLDEEARKRVLDYVANRFAIKVHNPPKASPTGERHTNEQQNGQEDSDAEGGSQLRTYETFSELFDAANPQTGPEKALVAAYWIQVCGDAATFEGFPINNELKHLGHGIANITTALDGLKNQKPALVLQTQKAGKTKQARKTYKLSIAGIKAVEAMLRG